MKLAGVHLRCSGSIARKLWPDEARSPALRLAALQQTAIPAGIPFLIVAPDDQPAFAMPIDRGLLRERTA